MDGAVLACVVLAVVIVALVITMHGHDVKSIRGGGSGGGSGGGGSSRIPRRILQTWKTRVLSPRMREIAQSWELLNRGYVYGLYDDADCRRLIEVKFGAQVLAAYDGIAAGAFKADLWRYCALYVHGGVYVDLDTLCIGPIDAVIDPTAELVVPVDLNNRNLFNAFLGAIPRHPVMLACIHQIVKNVENGMEQTGFDFSGPGLLGNCVADHLGLPRGVVFAPGTYGGVQLLDFSPLTEIVSSIDGKSLFLNKNGDSGILHVYMAESAEAGVVRYRA